MSYLISFFEQCTLLFIGGQINEYTGNQGPKTRLDS
jgi:hypothetical protein